MGCSCIGFNNCPVSGRPSGNPDPSRWERLDCQRFPNAFVLKVRYLDATNFGGVKILVFEGPYRHIAPMDPHFQEGPDSPVARFIHTDYGWLLALRLAVSL